MTPQTRETPVKDLPRTTTRRERMVAVASVALGFGLTTWPAQLGRWAGTGEGSGTRLALRASGVRKMVTGTGLVASRNPAPWWRARVVGDAMDITVLALAWHRRRDQRGRLGAMITGLAAVTSVDLWAARRASTRWAELGRGVAAAEKVVDVTAHNVDTPHIRGIVPDDEGQVSTSITVRQSTMEAYQAWRRLDRLPEFMTHLESVVEGPNGTSHWVASAPAGQQISWDAQIIDDQPGERLEWRSLPGSEVSNHGRVTFREAPAGLGTEVTVSLEFQPPVVGRAGAFVARLFGEHPQQQVGDDLRRFKQMLETGEVLRSDGSPRGSRTIDLTTQHPAAPDVSAAVRNVREVSR